MRTARQCVSAGLAALMLAACTLQSCTAWYSQAPAPTMFDNGKPPRKVRVTLAGGKQIFLLSPSFSGDSLIGIEPSHGVEQPATGYVTVPLDEIAEVAFERIEPLRTTLMVVGIGGVAWLVYAALTFDPLQGAAWTSSSAGADPRGRP